MELKSKLPQILNDTVDKIISKLGESNDSEIATATLAAFKLIFIPIATMSDKKSSQKQKVYAVKRDFLTESIALAGYIGITAQIKKLFSGPVCKKYYMQKARKLEHEGIIKENSDCFKILSTVNSKELALNALKQDKLTKTQKINIENLTNAINEINLKIKDNKSFIQEPKELYLNTKKTISHICVCTLALTVIPFVTNKVLEIIAQKNKNLKKINVDKNSLPKSIFPTKNHFKHTYNSTFPNMTEYMNITRLGGVL